MRALILLALALALTPSAAAAPARLAVRAELRGDGLRVTWPAVAGATQTCVLAGGRLLGCGGSTGWHQTSVDVALRVRVGQVVEVRAWRGVTLVATGRTAVMEAMYLPMVSTKRPPPR